MADIILNADIVLNTDKAFRDITAFSQRAERSLNSSFGRAGNAADDFNRRLEISSQRLISFSASAGSIIAVEKGFQELLSATISVEKQLTDLNVIFNLSDKTLKSFGNSLFDVAKNTGQSFKVAAEAATEFARQGLGVQETLKRTNDALILSRLTGLETKESVDDLTASLNTFQKAALSSTELVNKLANVDAKYAVSSRDLAEGIKISGSSAQASGTSIEELIGLITSLQETTARGGNNIGNSLKTIFERSGRSDTLDLLERFKVEVRDAHGEALNATKIFTNLAKTFDSLSGSQQNQIVQTVAGIHQANAFRAIMADLAKANSVYARSTQDANEETDTAIKRNADLNKTFSARFSILKQNATQLGAKVGTDLFNPILNEGLAVSNQFFSSVGSSDGIGKKVGEGIVKGIGEFIAGPGVAAITVILGKIFFNVARYSAEALQSLLRANNATQDQINTSNSLLNVERSILGVLQSQAAARGAGVLHGPNIPIPGPASLTNRPVFNQTFGTGPRQVSAVSFPGLNDGSTLEILNGEMSRLQGLVGTPGFNQGSSANHLKNIANNLALTDSEIATLLETYRTNVSLVRQAQAAQEAYNSQLQALQAEITALSESGGRIFGGSSARARLGAIAPEVAGAVNAQRSQRISNIAFGASIAAPIIGGIANEFIPDTSLSGRRTRSVVSGLSDVASFSALGGTISPTPVGFGAGAAVGAVVAIGKALAGWNDVLPDLEKNLSLLNEKISSQSDRLAQINQLFDQLDHASDPKAIERLKKSIYDLVTGGGADFVNALQSGGRSGFTSNLSEIIQSNKQQAGFGGLEEYIRTYLDKNEVTSTQRGADGKIRGVLNSKGTDLINSLSVKFGSLGLDDVFKNKDVISNLLTAMQQPGADASKLLYSAVANSTDPSKAESIVKPFGKTLSGLGSLANVILPEVLKKQFTSSYSVNGLFDKITQNPVDTGPDNRPLVSVLKNRGLAAFLGSESAANSLRVQNSLTNIRGQSSLDSLLSSQQLELGLQSPFLSPEQLERLKAHQSRVYTAQSFGLENQSNQASLAPTLAEFGQGTLSKLIETTSSNAPENAKLLDFLTNFKGTLGTSQDNLLNGTQNLDTLQKFVQETRNKVLTGGAGFTDKGDEKEILSSLEGLLRTINETSQKEKEITEKNSSANQKISDDLKRVVDLITQFQTRPGLEGLYNSGRISGRDFTRRNDAIRENNLTQSDFTASTGLKDTFQAFTDEFRYNLRDAFQDLESAARDVAQTINSSLKQSLLDFTNGTKSASQALQSFGLTILNKILERSIDSGINSLTSGVVSSASTFASSYFGHSRGGPIGRYAGGGKVSGGSGVVDDLPMMLPAGSFVIRKSSVAKYGDSFLNKLNNGGRLRMASGGSASILLKNQFDYNDPSHPTGGAINVDSNLSNFALTDENSPQNALRMTREANLYSYLKEKIDYDNQNAQILKNFKNAQNQRLIGAYISAAAGVGGAGLSYYGSSASAASASSVNNSYQYNNSYNAGSDFVVSSRAFGGYMRAFRTGGANGKDNIPALLTGGEYVMSPGAVQTHGIDFMNRLNYGQVPKFAEGGLVGQTSSGNPSDKLYDILSKLVESTSSLRDVLDKGKGATKAISPVDNKTTNQTAPTINNYTTVSIQYSGTDAAPKADTKTSSDSSQTDKDKQRGFADQVKAAVLSVMQKESKPGGFLYQQYKK